MRRLLALTFVVAITLQHETATADVNNRAIQEVSAEMQEWIKKDCRAGLPGDLFIACITTLAQQLPPIDPTRREYFGEEYDPKEWLQCMKRGYERSRMYGIGGCEKFRLRRLENPEYWPYPDAPKFKWPEAPKESVYQPGMSSKEYFEALCKAEAGEFIYKTVENVEGVYQIRPRQFESDDAMTDRYVMEDPYGYNTAEVSNKLPRQIVQPTYGQYVFVDIPNAGSITHYFRDETMRHTRKINVFIGGRGYHAPIIVNSKEIDRPSAAYGFTWRGISRPHDRELGIAGGEMAIIDLQSGDVLALRRGFRRSGYMKNSSGFWWLTAQHCSPELAQPGYRFIEKILRPVKGINEAFTQKIIENQ